MFTDSQVRKMMVIVVKHILALRAQGMTYREINEKLGLQRFGWSAYQIMRGFSRPAKSYA